jgi:ribosomal protein S18 acetylase RimI-like enzyme
MLEYRTFRNVDPPALVAIWRSRAGTSGLAHPVSVDLLERLIFGKMYFDYEGVTIAFEGNRPVGFAHAAFGPNDARDRIDTDKGVICLVVVRPDSSVADVAAGLLERSEAYLYRRGAKVVYGGAVEPLNPFYLGLYGGSELPGVLHSDAVAMDLFQSHGYRELDRTVLFRRPLGDFRPVVDRRQLQFRRQMTVQMQIDPPLRDWWESCTVGDFDLTRFEVMQRGGTSVLASVTFRAADPPLSAQPTRAAGLLDLRVGAANRRQGLATFLLGEAFRSLARQGVAMVEMQTTEGNQAGLGLCRKLGMQEIQQGVVFRKDIRNQSLMS